MLKLIERFYDVTRGSVTVDGVDVRDVRQRDLRAQLGYVPQKAFLFSRHHRVERARSRDEAMRRRTAWMRAVHRPGRRVRRRRRTEGVRLVRIAGRHQRVGRPAPAPLPSPAPLATDARAYLFDDSFSALDYKTDAALRAGAARAASGGKTVVIVAQRISTVLHADQIVVLDDGQVVGTGHPRGAA